MKKLFTLFFALVAINGYSQNTNPQYLGNANSNVIVQAVLNMADSPKASFNLILPDTATAKTRFDGKLKGRWARESGRLYHNPTGLKFVLADSVTGGGTGTVDSNLFSTVTRLKDTAAALRLLIGTGGIDTTSISNRIEARVKYTDTTAMLASYLNSGDIGVSVQGYNASTTILGNTTSGSGSTILLQGSPTITLPNIAAINVSGGILSLPTGASGTLMRLADTSTLSTRINNKLSISDTATMLSPYLRKVDTTAMLLPYLRDADTAAMLANYSTRINAKLNITDTSSMLANYYDFRDTGRSVSNITTGGTLKKVSDSLAALIGGGGVAVASVAEVNTGTDNAKFLSPLAIQGSKYLDQSGTKLAGTTEGTATAYTLTLTPAITAYTTGLSLWVKFHLANTGASTININGLGNKNLVKDISTALVANDIPINQWYALVYDGTNFLIQDIGFGGVNLSARLSGSLSDETGTGVAVFSASPTFTGVPSAPTAAAATNTTQIATTAHVFAERTNTATLTNKTLTSPSIATPLITGLSSGTTSDSLLVADAATGAVKRISSSRIGGGGGSGWGLTGNAGTTAGTNFVGTTDARDLWFKRNGVIGGYISSTSTAFGLEATFTYQGASNVTAIGQGALRANLQNNNTATGTDAARSNTTGGNNTVAGMTALYSNTTASGSCAFGKGAGLQSNGDNNIFVGMDAGFAATSASKSIVISTSGELPSNTTANQVNIGNVIWASGASGTGTTAAGSVSIGTNTPNASAIFELSSTTKGLLLPRMTDAQVRAITSPVAGLTVYNTDINQICFYNGTAWQKVTNTAM